MFNYIKTKIEKYNKTKTQISNKDEFFNEPIINPIKQTSCYSHCESCTIKDICTEVNNCTDLCSFAPPISDIDISKPVILIIDDNEGMVSFLKDDIIFLKSEKQIDSDIQILTISGPYCAFALELLLLNTDIIIKYAIIDITLGGSVKMSKGLVKYTGIDIYNMLYQRDSSLKYFFYTGNKLNPLIKLNKYLINQYNKISGKDILDSVLFKTVIDMDKRREYIAKNIFGTKC